jgi:hypothetical protein
VVVLRLTFSIIRFKLQFMYYVFSLFSSVIPFESCGYALNDVNKFPQRLMNLLTPLCRANPSRAANKPSTRNPTPSFATFLRNLYVSYWHFMITTSNRTVKFQWKQNNCICSGQMTYWTPMSPEEQIQTVLLSACCS